MSVGDEHVLDRDRHAGERAERLARRAPAVDVGGDVERALAVDVQEGVDGAVDGGDAVEVRLRGLDGGDVAGGELAGERRGGEADQFVVLIMLFPHPGSPGP